MQALHSGKVESAKQHDQPREFDADHASAWAGKDRIFYDFDFRQQLLDASYLDRLPQVEHAAGDHGTRLRQ